MLDVEFHINKEILGLLGASGCGKSMTLKCIAGVETPDEGEIILNNRVLFHSKKKINLLPQARKVGLLFQSYALFPNMTLWENILIGVPKNSPNRKEIVSKKIKDFSLIGLEDNYPHQLSGGQQQRVALARMLVNEPEIILLDEPFSALDEHLKWQMEEELISVLNKHKGSTLYVSHNKDEVYRICHKVAILNDGKIKEIDEKEELFLNPKTLNAAQLTGYKNISKVKKIGANRIYAIDWNLELELDKVIGDDISYVGIHTHHINITHDTQGQNMVNLKILNKIENLLTYTIVLSNNKSVIYLELSKKEYDAHNIKSKNSIFVEFNQSHLLLLK